MYLCRDGKYTCYSKVNFNPLFSGKNEEDQLRKIFAVMGSPQENDWPELSTYCDYNKYTFEETEPKEFSEICPSLDECGLDLLEVTINRLNI